MIDKEYIIEVLGRFEGKAIGKAYVPKDKAGNVLGVSGVTVATGFDIGQQTAVELGKLGLPEALREKLMPYVGLRKEAAVKKLEEKPLELSAEEVDVLDQAVHEKYIKETAVMYGPQFEVIPKQAQAVAVSLHYQFGVPRRDASPALGRAWDMLKTRSWKTAAEYLAAGIGWSADHRQYLGRRRQEAGLLLEIKEYA
ncbi:MAG: pesticin C-terminus-like muramidase [Spirochaetaceae bacterium]|nr:pesticin C-terminus-like muramidase [Spirochaetaceae bacterium]